MKKYEPKVSIVIPAYNASNYLAEAIDSALSQTYKNFEIIVVNDGSSDNDATRIVAEHYVDKIKYIEKENGGSSSALNEGIKNMSGEWFSWLSHDDLYYSNKLEEEINYLNYLIQKGLKEYELYKYLLFGSADLIDGSGKIIRKESEKKICNTEKKINCRNGTLNLIAVPTQDGFHGCSCLVNIKALEDIGMFDENLRLLNDMDLWYRFYINNYIVHFIPKVLVCGRVHSSQISRGIGFSYHNAEQDMFWSRSLKWLEDNHPENYEMFCLFSNTAYKKTRNLEGKAALKVAKSIKPRMALFLSFKSIIYRFYAILRRFAKRVYLKIEA